MRTTLFVFASMVTATVAGVKYRGQVIDTARRVASERWVDANHLRVLTRGVWQDVELMPLADHLCQSRQPMFQRYCVEPR